jgi:RNA polymerase sigma-70 factor (ECF subfamily)
MLTDAYAAIDDVYRREWGRIVATLIRLVGDFDLAEEAAQEAFTAAARQWEESGIPGNPRAWIIRTARHKAIDRLRREKRLGGKLDALAEQSPGWEDPGDVLGADESGIGDDRLRLIFTCCHPALGVESQVALTLRTLGGLDTEEIARAFLVPVSTMAQRLVRTKRKIRDAGIPYVVPGRGELEERLGAVLRVVYLIFNEGYAATRGKRLVRRDLAAEAIRLGRLLRTLMSSDAPGEATGLLALMLLHDSRRDARVDSSGDLVTLEEQDRSLWDRSQIDEALGFADEAFEAAAGGVPGPFTVQAAIAAQHCRAATPELTDWARIVRLYDVLERLEPSAIVSLNRAVAVAMAEGPERGLALVDALVDGGELEGYHLLHATRADMLRRLGMFADAGADYRRALGLATNERERRFLERRLVEVRIRSRTGSDSGRQ